eukprot:3789794-Rhodomonas_salina.1
MEAPRRAAPDKEGAFREHPLTDSVLPVVSSLERKQAKHRLIQERHSHRDALLSRLPLTLAGVWVDAVGAHDE